MQIFATTDGVSAAIPISLALDANSVRSDPSGAIDGAHSQVTEFSAPAGNDLEIVATIVFRSEYSPSFAEPSQAVLPDSLLANREPEEAEGLTIIDVYGGNDPDTLDRNSVITGASETPVQRYLDRRMNAEGLPPKQGNRI